MTNCEKTKDLLWAFCEGMLEREEASRVEAHLKECASCTMELAGVRATLAALGAVEAIEPGADFQERLCEKIDAWEARRQTLWLTIVAAFVRRNRRLLVSSGLAFFLALFGGLYALHSVLGPEAIGTHEGTGQQVASQSGTGYEGIAPAVSAQNTAGQTSSSQGLIMRDIPYQPQMVTITRGEGADTIYTRFPTRDVTVPRSLERDKYVYPTVTPVSASQPIY